MELKDELKEFIHVLDPHNFRRSKYWDRAYILYNQKNERDPVKVGCSSCAFKVFNWAKDVVKNG